MRCWGRETQGASSGELVGEVLGGEVGEAVGRVGQCSERGREGGVLGRLWEGSPGEPTSISPVMDIVWTTEAMEHDVHPPLDRLQHECLHIRGEGDSPRRQFLHF
jgi:hypothetical protein